MRLLDIANGLTVYYGKEFIIGRQEFEKCKFSFDFNKFELKEALAYIEEKTAFKTDERSDYVVLEDGSCPEK